MVGPAAGPVHAWSCPVCGRSVPSREDVCHCGCRRPPPAPASDANPWHGALLGPLLLPAAVLLLGVVFASARRDGGTPDALRAEARSGARPRPAPRYPALPLAAAPAEPLADEPPAHVPADDEATLDALFLPLSEQADALDADYAAFVRECPRTDDGAGEAKDVADAPVERDWYALWHEDAAAGGPGAPPDGVPFRTECLQKRGDLALRANGLARSLEAFEVVADERGLEPQARRLLSGARLGGWREARPKAAGDPPARVDPRP